MTGGIFSLDNCNVTLQIVEFVLHDIPRIRRHVPDAKSSCVYARYHEHMIIVLRSGMFKTHFLVRNSVVPAALVLIPHSLKSAF